MSAQVRFGIIGCGEIAVQTCMAISAAPNATVAMLMDSSPEVLADLAELYSARTTTNVDDVLNSPEVDAVYIATPHDLHAPLGIEAARAGKHVLVEKPIATTLEDADALIATCSQSGVRLGVAFLAQTDDVLAQARALVRAGLLGEIISVRITALGDKPATYWRGGYTGRVTTDWRMSKARAGGGILIMNVVHDLNTVRWVGGLEAQRVYAEADTLATDVEVEDTIGVVLRYTSRAIGTIHAGSAMRGGAHQDARGPRLYGTKGQLILGSPVLAFMENPPEGGKANAWQELKVPEARGGRQAMVEGFSQAVLEGKEPPATGLDGRKALEMIVAAYRSAETGKPVELPL